MISLATLTSCLIAHRYNIQPGGHSGIISNLSGHLASLFDDVVLQAPLVESLEEEAVVVDLPPVCQQGVLAGCGRLVAVS